MLHSDYGSNNFIDNTKKSLFFRGIFTSCKRFHSLPALTTCERTLPPSHYDFVEPQILSFLHPSIARCISPNHLITCLLSLSSDSHILHYGHWVVWTVSTLLQLISHKLLIFSLFQSSNLIPNLNNTETWTSTYSVQKIVSHGPLLYWWRRQLEISWPSLWYFHPPPHLEVRDSSIHYAT